MLEQAVLVVKIRQGRALKHPVAAKIMDLHTNVTAVQNHLAMIVTKANQSHHRNLKVVTTMMAVEIKNQRKVVQKSIKVTRVEIAFLEAIRSFNILCNDNS